MSDQPFSIARLTKEQKEEIELLEMKACLALLDDQIVQLHRYRDFHSDTSHPESDDVYHALMASVEQSTALARRMNALAQETLHERVHRRLPGVNRESLLN
jgi:hypothetical protein